MRRKPLHRLVLSVAALTASLPAAGLAQSRSRDAESGTWALINARIETVTRGTIDRGTVIIRNGVIEAVGATVATPADARVVDLSGKTLYPGFIDLTSSMGLPQPAAGRGGGRGGIPPELAAFLPPQEDSAERIVGLEPNRSVATELRMTVAEVRAARDAGVAAVLVSPSRGLFRGLSALVPMRDDTATRWIVKSPFSWMIF